MLSLVPPYKPLSSDTIGSITKRILESHGVNPKFWGAHSTGGAGVGLIISLGLSSEEVCEIGKWKGVEAFVAFVTKDLVHKKTWKTPCLP